jgi:hypothetical protein
MVVSFDGSPYFDRRQLFQKVPGFALNFILIVGTIMAHLFYPQME